MSNLDDSCSLQFVSRYNLTKCSCAALSENVLHMDFMFVVCCL